ncbi:glutamate formimidoyltransferase [Chloroflexota bacterium]
MRKFIECIPNFSEGRDEVIIQQLAKTVENSDIELLSVESDASYNRTVITFAGSASEVKEAAFAAIKTAARIINMTQHKGQHPRIGATDVCPFVPISSNDEDCIRLAHELGRQVGSELDIPVYIYGQAATNTQRRELSAIRKGEYEGLKEKLKQPEWQPDYGTAVFNAQSGATLIGVRQLQVAYNVNLNTDDVKMASKIAGIIRQSGRIVNGVRNPGTLIGVRAMGILLESHGIAQVSLNLDDLASTPLHVAYEEVCRQAESMGYQVTGSEVCGLVPKKSLVDAGRYWVSQSSLSLSAESELIRLSIDRLGLDQLYHFNPQKKVLEYALGI